MKLNASMAPFETKTVIGKSCRQNLDDNWSLLLVMVLLLMMLCIPNGRVSLLLLVVVLLLCTSKAWS